MFKRIYKAIKEAAKGKPLKLRSSHWEALRQSHLETNPQCAACEGLVSMQVHHIKPFHIYPELELDKDNLITLCENKETKCHLKIGHLGSWRNENPDVVQNACAFKLELFNKNRM